MFKNQKSNKDYASRILMISSTHIQYKINTHTILIEDSGEEMEKLILKYSIKQSRSFTPALGFQ